MLRAATPALCRPLSLSPSHAPSPPRAAAAESRALIDEMSVEARKISSGGTLMGPNDAEQTLITMSTLTGGGGAGWVALPGGGDADRTGGGAIVAPCLLP